MLVGCLVHAFLSTVMLPVTLQSQREDPDAIYGTVDDDVYAAVGNTGQSYYSMVCLTLGVCVYTYVYVSVYKRVCVKSHSTFLLGN